MSIKPLLPRWVWATSLLPALLFVPVLASLVTTGIALFAVIGVVLGGGMMLTAIGGSLGMLQLHRSWRAVKVVDGAVSVRNPDGRRVSVPVGDIVDVVFDAHRSGAQVPTIVRADGGSVAAALGYVIPVYRNGIWNPSRVVDEKVVARVAEFVEVLRARGAPLRASAGLWTVVGQGDERRVIDVPPPPRS